MGEKTIKIRRYQEKDGETLYQLYQETVRAVCSRDYTEEEIKAWLSKCYLPGEWNEKLKESSTFTAVAGETRTGFGNVLPDGYIDCFCIHKDFQRQGIGKALLARLEEEVKDDAVTEFGVHVSKTARPFFESQGYEIECVNTVERDGVLLTNFYMKKERRPMFEKRQKKRKKVAEEVKACQEEDLLAKKLWELICLYEGCHFFTSKQLPFQYKVKGGELFCDRRAKSITQATILRAYQKVREAEKEGDPITGPKRLGIFGAPYVWSIFKTAGLVETKTGAEKPGRNKTAD